MIFNTEDIIDYVQRQYISLAAILGSGWAFWFKIGRPVMAWGFRTAEIVSKLDKLVAEVSPNGGSSMRDAINRIEANQVKTEERVRILLLDSSDGIWESDAQGMCIWANRTLLNIIDLELHEVVGNGWIAAIQEDQRNRVVLEWRHAVEDKREFRLDFPYQTRSGEIRNVSCRASPMLKLGKVCGWIGVVKRV